MHEPSFARLDGEVKTLRAHVLYLGGMLERLTQKMLSDEDRVRGAVLIAGAELLFPNRQAWTTATLAEAAMQSHVSVEFNDLLASMRSPDGYFRALGKLIGRIDCIPIGGRCIVVGPKVASVRVYHVEASPLIGLRAC